MRLGLVFIVLWGAFSTAFAQEDAAYDGTALAQSIGARAEMNVRHYGAYLNGRVSVGTLVVVGQASESSGYDVTTQWDMAVGDSSFSNRVTAKLDAHLAVLDWREIESETMGEATATTTTHLKYRKRNRWVGEQSNGGAVVKGELKVKDHAHHGTLESLLFLVPEFAKNKPGVYRFSEIMNRLDKAPESELLSPAYFDLHIHETANFEHRGQQIPVRVVRALWNANKTMTFIVSESSG